MITADEVRRLGNQAGKTHEGAILLCLAAALNSSRRDHLLKLSRLCRMFNEEMIVELQADLTAILAEEN